jgi:hypothetical protein
VCRDTGLDHGGLIEKGIKKMKKILQRVRHFSVFIMILSVILQCTARASGIPEAPVIEGAEDGNYLKVANQLSMMVIGFIIPLLYAVTCFSYCGGMIYLFNRAKEKEEWGGFFKAGIIGLGLIMLILYLLNAIKNTI